MSTPSLRDHLVSSLSTHANPFDLDLTVVSSLSKRTNAIFPHARHPPKCYEKQYVITVGVTLPPSPSQDQETPKPGTSTSNGGLDTSTNASGSSTSRKVLVTALHAYLYILPRRHILYISKLDTSGYLPSSAPITKSLIGSFISFHLRPDVAHDARVQVQLFARSQGQYLFPNSSQAPGKRVAGGLKLCAWWKGVYEAVAANHAQLQPRSSEKEQNGAESQGNGDRTEQRIHLRYLLPSYSGDEAAGMLGAPKVTLPPGLQWIYGPPFTTPFESKGEGQDNLTSLGLMIPSLPDDPKTRFLDELVAEAGPSRRQEQSAPRASNGTVPEASDAASRPREGQDAETDTNAPGPTVKVDDSRALGPRSSGATLVELPKPPKPKVPPIHSHKEKEKERDEADRKAAELALSKTSHEEFWERMGFKQECISGDVTGFFTLELDPPMPPPATASEVPSRTLDKAASTATVVDTPDLSTSRAPSINGSAKAVPHGVGSTPTDIPHGLVDRVLASLLNCDFATLPLALESSQIWSVGVRGIVVGEIGETGWRDCTALIPATHGNGAEVKEKRKEEVVTMLQPRKKKKV